MRTPAFRSFWLAGYDGADHLDRGGRPLSVADLTQHVRLAPSDYSQLRDFGIRAVISTSIADIFFSNALKNGLVPVRIDAASHAWLLAHPGAAIEIDVGGGAVVLPDGRRAAFALDPFARHCLVNGIDELGYLLSHLSEMGAWERAHGRT